MTDYFNHPYRATQNSEGPFYGVDIGADCGCGLPEEIAPDLIVTGSREEGFQSYFYKQPQRESEIQRAIEAVNICPIHDLRYGGMNPGIIRKIEPSRSDYYLSALGVVKLNDMGSSK